MATKLNSMRILEQHAIPYEALDYPDSIKDAVQVGETLGVPPAMIYKTLVVESSAGGKPFLVLVAADRQLDLKAVARAAGEKKVKMAAQKDAERATGLQVGGISPLALLHKNWDVYLDERAAELTHVLISAGQRGIQLRLPVQSLIDLVHAKIAPVSV